jgi:hypothetical protein
MKKKLIMFVIRWLWVHHEGLFRAAVREFKYHVGRDPVRKKGEGE